MGAFLFLEGFYKTGSPGAASSPRLFLVLCLAPILPRKIGRGLAEEVPRDVDPDEAALVSRAIRIDSFNCEFDGLVARMQRDRDLAVVEVHLQGGGHCRRG